MTSVNPTPAPNGRGHSQVTLAISDNCSGGLEGFAPLSGPLASSIFAAAFEDGEAIAQSGATHSIFVDLMDDDGNQTDEKRISLAQASQILGMPASDIIPVGRQRLAQINDEDACYVANRSGRRAMIDEALK